MRRTITIDPGNATALLSAVAEDRITPRRVHVNTRRANKRAVQKAMVEARVARGELPPMPAASAANSSYTRVYEAIKAAAEESSVEALRALRAKITGINTYARRARTYADGCIAALEARGG